MSAIDKVTKHYADQGTKKTHVKEWDLDIFYKPPTPAVFEEIKRRAGGESSTHIKIAVYTLIVMAMDKDGNPLFTVEDKFKLMNRSDLKILLEVGETLAAFKTMEEQEGNLETTPA